MGESQLKNAPTGWNHFIFTWRGPPIDTGGAPNKHCQTSGLLLFDGKKNQPLRMVYKLQPKHLSIYQEESDAEPAV
jgi:hypothetical protein